MLQQERGDTTTREKKRAHGYTSSYFIFMDDTRDEMRKHYPCAKGSEITKLLGKAWKCLSDEEKEKYAERAREKWRQVLKPWDMLLSSMIFLLIRLGTQSMHASRDFL